MSRGGARSYTICPGSNSPPSAIEQQLELSAIVDVPQPIRGACSACGKLVVLNKGGKIPQHKPLSEVVQRWREEDRET